MKEVLFLKQNAEKWKSIESALEGSDALEPDLLAERFIQLTDDLSYSKTYYPESNTTTYLNDLTARIHQLLYRNKKERTGRLITFWRDEYPRVMAAARKELLASFLVFIIAVALGVVSTLNDQSFVRLILGDSYVNKTLEYIQNNDPMAVYKKMNEMEMFLGITLNNIRVAFYAFVIGVLFSVGTGFLLFYNGVMVGAFHTFFYQKGLLGTAVKVIWIHGTLEISAIIVAGAAGFAIGNSILFPGTFTRGESFRRGARKGLKMVMGLLPFFVVAGFLEGFITRHTEMPTFVSMVIIWGSLALVVWYFLVLPISQKKEEANVQH